MTTSLEALSPAIWLSSFVASISCLVLVLASREKLPRQARYRWWIAGGLTLFIVLNGWYFSRALAAGGGAHNLPTIVQGLALLNFLSAAACYFWFLVADRETE